MSQDKTNTKNNQNKSVWIRRMSSILLRLAASAVLIWGAVYLCLHFMEYQRSAVNQVNKYRIDQVEQMSNDTMVWQKFRARHKHLRTVRVYFGNDYAGASGKVVLEIRRDSDGDSLAKIKKKISELGNYEYTEFNTDLILEKGEYYSIFLTGEKIDPGKGPLLFQWKTREAGFKGKMRINYITQKKYLVAKLYYPVTIYRQWAGIGLSALILIFLLWFPLPLPEKWKKKIGYVLAGLSPLFIFWVVERFTDNPLTGIRLPEFFLNIILYYMFFGLLYVITNSKRMAVTIGCVFWYIVGLANYYVLSFKGAPIVPSDMMSARTGFSVAGNYSYTIQPVFVWNLIFTLLFLAVLWRCPSKRQKTLKLRIILLALVVTLSVILGHFVVEQKTFKSFGIRNNVWDQKKGYAKNGFFFGFVLNMNSLVQEKPADYSADAAEDIALKYEEIYANRDKDKKKGKLVPPKGQKPNIIFIMNEALADLSVVGDFETNKDYMPYIHSLKENTIRGSLYMSIFGSGTCNSEFECLTGNTMTFLRSGIIAYTQVIRSRVPNVTWNLKSQGYNRCLAMHPYLATGWNRIKVYEDMGFDQFLSETSFEKPLMYRKYISDESDFKKIVEMYEKRVNPDDPFYLFNVTMQNHGGFDKEYDNFTNEIQITDIHKNEQAEQYLSLVKKSDEAFKQLTDYFSEVDEPTIIVMFGDHQPAVASKFYESVMGKTDGELKGEERFLKYQTPFIIWTNYDIKDTRIKAMSANYLGAYVMKEAGLKITPYQQFILDLREKLPVICSMGCLDKDGNYYKSGLDSPYSDLVKEYQILQYNNLIDTRNTVDSFFYPK